MQKPLRILLVTETYPPEINGVAMTTQRMVQGLRARGPRVGNDLAAHYASADLFLFGSLSETWGNVLTEAMVSGLSVTTYQHAAAEILIRDGENGSAVTALADDGDTRRGFGNQARHAMREHGWEVIVGRIEEAMREVLASSHRVE